MRWQRLLTAIAVMLGSAWLVSPAGAYIYWSTGKYDTIGRANNDGAGVNNAFLLDVLDPHGLALGPHGADIYWSVPGTKNPGHIPALPLGSVGRGALKGRKVLNHFIVLPLAFTCRVNTVTLRASHCHFDYDFSVGDGVAVDSAHVYWTERHYLRKRHPHTGGDIGRANLDGSDRQGNFIPTGPDPTALAVDGTHIYWVNSDTGTIGRATLIGGGVDQHFIRGATGATGLALGVNRAFIYWSSRRGTIGRANYDGTGVKRNFITGADHPRAVAVDATHIYWVNANGTIGRANLDGTGVDRRFIKGAHFAVGLTVDTGGAVGAASASQSSLSGFAPRKVGTTSPPQTVTITNSGDGPLKVTQAQITGADPHDFVVSGDTCLGTSVAPGATCTLDAGFSPTASGARNATLELISNDPSGPLLIPMTGGEPWSLSLTSVPDNSTGTPVTVTATANDLLIGTSDYINLYVNGKFATKCQSTNCELSLSSAKPTLFTVSADVGPARRKPFTSGAMASTQTTVYVSYTPPHPGPG
jgi:hypothetical protein